MFKCLKYMTDYYPLFKTDTSILGIHGKHMDVSKNSGGPPKWMVKTMVPNPMNKWMIWGGGSHYFLETPIYLFKFHRLYFLLGQKKPKKAFAASPGRGMLGFFVGFFPTRRRRCFIKGVYMSGQIITTSAEVTLNGGLIRELPQNSLNSGLGIILICPDMCDRVELLVSGRVVRRVYYIITVI